MRHRVLPWRRQFSTATTSDGSYVRPRSAFTRHVDENEGIYYTVATKEEGKMMPRQPHSDKLFTMPNLIIDLDAESMESTSRVREYTAADEERLRQEWATSPKERLVKARMAQLSTMLDASRTKTRELLHDPAHPFRITDHDIASIALRGSRSPTIVEKQGKEEGNSGRLVITTLSQLHLKSNDGLPASAFKLAEERHRPKAAESPSGFGQLIDLGDPRRQPDYMEQLHAENGIPPYATREDERLVRWMIHRQYNLGHAEEGIEVPMCPSAEQVARAVREQDPTRGGITSIRRIVFSSIRSGCELTADVAVQVKDFCARILNTYPNDPSLQYEVLTLANNLVARLPSAGAEITRCTFALRMRALAGLGLTESSVALLRQDSSVGLAEGSSVDLLGDVEAAITSWLAHLDHNPVLQTADARRDLFCLLTGFRTDSTKPPAASYSNIILAHESHEHGSRRTSASEKCVELLDRLGEPQALWSEWGPGKGTRAQMLEAASSASDQAINSLRKYLREGA